MKVLGIGEVLWDVFPDQELLGGAALNFCANLQRLGDTAIPLSGVGKDRRGELVCEAMSKLELETGFVQSIDEMPTGVALVQVDSEGEPHFTIQRPAAFDGIVLSPRILARIATHEIDWLYFGTLMQTAPGVEQATSDLIHHLPTARCFYDMNLRAGHWNIELVKRLCGLASILKLNESEAKVIGELTGTLRSEFSLESFCREWAERFEIDVICVTLGSRGCLIFQDGLPLWVPGLPITVRDTVGAGDAFAAAFLHGYHRGWPMLQTARFANSLGALVATMDGATPAWSLGECVSLSAVPTRLLLEDTDSNQLGSRTS
jgi:fructokinase